MKDTSRNTNKPSLNYWRIISFIFILIFLLFVNNYRYFIYALIISGIIFLVRKNSSKTRKEKGKVFLIIWSLIYFPLLILFSISPFLRWKEFQWTHPGWKEAKAQIISYESRWEKPYRKTSGYAYVNVSYEYKIAGQSYKNTEYKAEKLYYPLWENRDRIQILKAELQDRSKQLIDSQQFILLYNTHSPIESKIFISRPLFHPQGSELYAFSIVIGILMIAIIGGLISVRKIQASEKK